MKHFILLLSVISVLSITNAIDLKAPKVTASELQHKITTEKEAIQKTIKQTKVLKRRIKKLNEINSSYEFLWFKDRKSAYLSIGIVFAVVFTLTACIIVACVKKGHDEPEQKEEKVSFDRFRNKTPSKEEEKLYAKTCNPDNHYQDHTDDEKDLLSKFKKTTGAGA